MLNKLKEEVFFENIDTEKMNQNLEFLIFTDKMNKEKKDR